jgi:ATP-dependent RNA helicase DeaD
VISLSKQFLRDAEMLSLSHGAVHVAETEHVFYEVPPMKKDRSLVRIIEVENPDSAIIFCNTRENARYVSVVLQRFGYDADVLSADLDQKAREKVLKRVYEKNLRFLVATDVAARGIDIANLSHVINFDFPEDPESYVHRVGRTGRMGASGEAISLVDMIEKLKLASVARRYEVDILERTMPSDEDVEKVVADRMTNLLETRFRTLDRLVQERLSRMVPLARLLGENEEGHQLVAMLLDEYYHRVLHQPPDLPPADAAPLEREPAATEGSEEGGKRRGRSGGGGGRSGGSGGRSGGSGGRRRRRR